MRSKYNPFGTEKLRVNEDSRFERRYGSREERVVKEDLPKVVFSFKDFDANQIPPGQSYIHWQESKFLSVMLEKFGQICELTIVEAQQQRVLKIYDRFPSISGFKHPKHIAQDVKWAVIMDIKGQKGRVAGHIIGNVFFVVFLDKEHKFFITKK